MAAATGFEVRVARDDELERVVQLRPSRWACKLVTASVPAITCCGQTSPSTSDDLDAEGDRCTRTHRHPDVRYLGIGKNDVLATLRGRSPCGGRQREARELLDDVCRPPGERYCICGRVDRKQFLPGRHGELGQRLADRGMRDDLVERTPVGRALREGGERISAIRMNGSTGSGAR